MFPRVAPAIAVAIQQLPADLKLKAAQAFLKTEVKSSEVECPVVLERNVTFQKGITVKGFHDNPQTRKENTEVPSKAPKFSKRGWLLFKFLILEHDNVDQLYLSGWTSGEHNLSRSPYVSNLLCYAECSILTPLAR